MHLPGLTKSGVILLGVVVLVTAGVLAAVWKYRSPGVEGARLRGEFEYAMSAGEYETATGLFQTLEDGGHLAVHEQKIRFEAAQAYDKLQDRPAARRLMEQVAGLKHAAAHLWLAQDVLASIQVEGARFLEAQRSSPPEGSRSREQEFRKAQLARERKAEAHLEQTLEFEPENVEANRLMSRLNIAASRWKPAIENLSRLSVDGDENRLLLARVYNLDRQRDRARDEARRVLDSSSTRARRDPQDQKSAAMAVVAALMVGEYPTAAHFLDTSHRQGQDTPQLHSLRAMTYLGWSQRELREGEKGSAGALDLLEVALRQPPVPIESFLIVYQLAARGDARARDMLHVALARGFSPGLLHRMLGDLAEKERNTELAMRHYQAAIDADPLEGVSRNNLAWLLAAAQPPQLDRALELANDALRISPRFARFLDTRGQILVRMGRDQEALSDLRAAVGQMPENLQLHQALAGVYTRLKVPELAAEHQSRAKELSEPPGPPKERKE